MTIPKKYVIVTMKKSILHFPLGKVKISKSLQYVTTTHQPPTHLLSRELSQVQQLCCKTDVMPSDPGSSCISMRDVRKELVEKKHILPPFLLFTITQCSKTGHTKGLQSLKDFLVILHGNYWYMESIVVFLFLFASSI